MPKKTPLGKANKKYASKVKKPKRKGKKLSQWDLRRQINRTKP